MTARRPRRARSVAALTVGALAFTLAPVTMAAAADDPVPAEDEHKVLIFTKTTQFRHTEAITQGTPVLEAAFAEVGIESDHTEDSSAPILTVMPDRPIGAPAPGGIINPLMPATLTTPGLADLVAILLVR